MLRCVVLSCAVQAALLCHASLCYPVLCHAQWSMQCSNAASMTQCRAQTKKEQRSGVGSAAGLSVEQCPNSEIWDQGCSGCGEPHVPYFEPLHQPGILPRLPGFYVPFSTHYSRRLLCVVSTAVLLCYELSYCYCRSSSDQFPGWHVERWELCWTFISEMNELMNKSSFVGNWFSNILFLNLSPPPFKIAKGHFFLNNLLTVFLLSEILKKSDLWSFSCCHFFKSMFVTVIRAECRYTIVNDLTLIHCQSLVRIVLKCCIKTWMYAETEL
jgi:hypothetical protein